MSPHRRVLRTEWVAAFVIAAALYLPFVSRQFDLNGIDEALALDDHDLWVQNHLLYRPAGWLVQHLLEAVGLHIQTIFILQYLTAICATIAAALTYAFFRRISADRFVSAAVAFGLATSWSWWVFGTDAMYIPLAAMCVAAAAIVFVDGGNPGYWAGLSILVWEANVFLIPALVGGLLFLRRGSATERAKQLGCFLIASVCPVVCVYALAASQSGIRSPLEFLAWVGSHGRGAGLPMWGRAEWGRLLEAGQTALNSLALQSPMGSIPLIAILIASAFAGFHWYRRGERFQLHVLTWFAAAYLIYVPFIAWWDSAEAKWFVVPNIFLGAAAVHVTVGLADRTYSRLVLAVIVASVSMSNFVSTIWPRRFKANDDLAFAQCVARQMSPADLFVSPDWSYGGYLRYFYKRHEVGFVAEAANTGKPALTLRNVRARVGEVQDQKGNAYTMDLNEYSDAYFTWLEQQTGLTREALERFEGMGAFQCGRRTIRRVPIMESASDAYSLAEQAEFEAPAQGGTTVLSPDHGLHTKVGYADLTPPAAGLVFLDSRSDGVLQSETAVPLAEETAAGRFSVLIDHEMNASIALTNVHDQESHVEFSLLDRSGSRMTSGTLTVAPHHQVTRFLTESPFNAKTPFQGTLAFRSSLPLAVAAFKTADPRSTHFQFSRLPLIDSSGVDPSKQPLSHQYLYVEAAGGDDDDAEKVSTRVEIVNPSDQTVTLQLCLRDLTGKEQCERQETLQPRQSWSKTLDEIERGRQWTRRFQGTLSVESGVPVLATSYLERTTGGTKPITVEVPGLRPIQSDRSYLPIPEVASGGGFSSRFVLLNPSTKPAKFVLRFFSPTGEALQLPLR